MTKTDGGRWPAEAAHPSEFILDEMQERGWNTYRMAKAMGDDEWRENYLALDMYFAVGPRTPNLRIGPVMAQQIGDAFSTSAEYWLNLEAQWLAERATP